MKYSVYLSKKSENDIRDIYEYISDILLAPMNAESVFARLTKAVISLEEMPERHQVYKYQHHRYS